LDDLQTIYQTRYWTILRSLIIFDITPREFKRDTFSSDLETNIFKLEHRHIIAKTKHLWVFRRCWAWCHESRETV